MATDAQQKTTPEERAEGAENGDRDWPLDPGRVRLWEDEYHVLHLSIDGEEHEGVRPLRVFPFSSKADYVSFMDEDEHEVALVTNPDELDKRSRRALEKALGHMYYTARIQRVDELEETMGVTHWKVMTDRGYAAFEVVDRRHIRRLPGGRLIIVDVDGNRFEIENLNELDERSQVLIHSEI
jgi:hypothetical protein